jgi:poly-gamma-glutamate capsule biosynthesis protein CapA/YwtB (metallophosphatase superfamily)
MRLFLCGDVMTGRGVDQILRHPGDPRVHERYVDNAIDYVRLAERASGAIPRAAGDLGVMYFPRLASGGELLDLELVGLCRRRLRLERAPEIDCQWLCGVLNAEGRRFGTSFDLRECKLHSTRTR